MQIKKFERSGIWMFKESELKRGMVVHRNFHTLVMWISASESVYK